MEFIHNEKILQHDNFDDGLGSKNIWERIKKLGEDKFYRVEYDQNPEVAKKMSPEAKRKKAKEDIEGRLKTKQISTSIADTAYITNVISAYVNGDAKAAKQLYEEPVRSEKEQADIDRFLKQFGQMKKSWENKVHADEKEELLKKHQVKQDKTEVKSKKPYVKDN